MSPQDADPAPSPDPQAEPALTTPAEETGPEGGLGYELPDDDIGKPPLEPLPRQDFWEALYTRRSIRKFLDDPVPRELIDQVMHAGIWAPSSCNYQMWDLVAVDDAELNGRLAALSTQMGNAPVNIVVAYGRDFSEENWANIQSASALIQNMSLAAQVLGLGTFWITQTGDREKVREMVGLPQDRLVVAVVALGYPKVLPKKGPKRRPLGQVTHYNHYGGRPIPSSVDPDDWEPDLLAIYQRARVLNGLRHNKPRAWESRALVEALDALVPEGRAKAEGEAKRWLDVLPCTGILTERMARERKGFRFDVVERTPDVAAFCAGRVHPRGEAYLWPPRHPSAELGPPPEGTYDVVSCLFRLEDLRSVDRPALLAAMARWLKPGGRLLLGWVSRHSFHQWTEDLRRRRGGPGGVEYVLSPDPNIGPFQALSWEQLEGECQSAGLERRARLGLQVVPQPEEIAFRSRNFSPRMRSVAGAMGKVLGLADRPRWLQKRRGRFQFALLQHRDS